MPRTTLRIATALVCLVGGLSLLPGCAVETSSGGGGSSPTGPPTTSAPSQRTAPLDSAQAERIRRTMVPLIQAMNHPRPLNKVKVAVVDDPQINAASAGGGEFYVTTGLL